MHSQTKEAGGGGKPETVEDEGLTLRATRNPIFVEGWWIAPSILLGIVFWIWIGLLLMRWLKG